MYALLSRCITCFPLPFIFTWFFSRLSLRLVRISFVYWGCFSVSFLSLFVYAFLARCITCFPLLFTSFCRLFSLLDFVSEDPWMYLFLPCSCVSFAVVSPSFLLFLSSASFFSFPTVPLAFFSFLIVACFPLPFFHFLLRYISFRIGFGSDIFSYWLFIFTFIFT